MFENNKSLYLTSAETYENQCKYGQEVFEEFNTLQEEGFNFGGFHHDITVVSCCDWKAGACIEGTIELLMNFKLLPH